MLYSAGAEPKEDRPAHVRAGSGLAFFEQRLAVIQDDANFIALVDPRSAKVGAVALPRGPEDLRQFDDLRGNKEHKFDLEACVTVDMMGFEMFFAFGSGSSPRRENVVIYTGGDEVEFMSARELYALLRAEPGFAGSELNVEGVIVTGDVVRFFNRGNGECKGELAPVNATIDLSWPVLCHYLTANGPLPEAGPVTQYALGEIGGTRLSFTDATTASAGILYVAAAEDSPDTLRDGPVLGSAIGLIAGEDVRWTQLRDKQGKAFDGKVEGIALDPENSERAWLLIDRDDPERATELCRVALKGPWVSGGSDFPAG